jgi:hypothetical protein
VASNRGDIDRRVGAAAEAALAKRKFVTAIDVLVGVGWLEPRRVDEWRQGRVDYLERVTVANLGGSFRVRNAESPGTAGDCRSGRGCFRGYLVRSVTPVSWKALACSSVGVVSLVKV